MANILIRKTAHLDRDPFADSDSDIKYDSTAAKRFRSNYGQINWGKRPEKAPAKP